MQLAIGSVCILALLVIESVATLNCKHGQLPCDDGKCVDIEKWCDSIPDCQDDSDEDYCKKSWRIVTDPNKCRSHHFKCDNGMCIPQEGICDGFKSCSDGSDEINCENGTTIETTSEFKSHLTTLPYVDASTQIYTTLKETVSPSTEEEETTHFTSLGTTLKRLETIQLNDDENAALKHANTSLDARTNSATEPTADFKPLNTDSFIRSKSKAISWLLLRRGENFGWADDTARSLVALYMSNASLNGRDKMLMWNQLHLQLAVALIKNSTSPLSLCELSLYINALLSSCSDARNFHGVDLISILRQRADASQRAERFISPLVYLTLCLANETTYKDVKKVQDMITSKDLPMDRIDIKALASLASSCIVKMPKYAGSYLRHDSSRQLLQKILRNGLPENVYESALFTQAMNEARINDLLWHRSQALANILHHQDKDGSFGSIMATYYVLPILSGKSLVSLADHCQQFESGMTQVDVLKSNKQEKTYIQYSLRFGQPVEYSHTVMLRVPKKTHFLDIMKIAAEVNPSFKFEIDFSSEIPYVFSIGGMANDAERGMFWFLQTLTKDNSSNGTSLTSFHGDLRHYFPEAGVETVFWYKSIE